MDTIIATGNVPATIIAAAHVPPDTIIAHGGGGGGGGGGALSLASRLCNTQSLRWLSEALAAAHPADAVATVRDPFGRPPCTDDGGAAWAAIVYTAGAAMADMLRGGGAPDAAAIHENNFPVPPGARAEHLHAARTVRRAPDVVLAPLFYEVLVAALVDPRALAHELTTTRDRTRAWAVLAAPVVRAWLGGARTVAAAAAAAGAAWHDADARAAAWLHGLTCVSERVFAPTTLQHSFLSTRVAPGVHGLGSVLDGVPVIRDASGGGGAVDDLWEPEAALDERWWRVAGAPPSPIAGGAARARSRKRPLPSASGDGGGATDAVCPLLGARYFATLELTRDGGDTPLPLGVRACSVTGKPLAWRGDGAAAGGGVALRYGGGGGGRAPIGWGGSSTCVFTALTCLRMQGLLHDGVVLEERTRVLWMSRTDADTLRDCVMPPLADTRATCAALRSAGDPLRVCIGARRLLLGSVPCAATLHASNAGELLWGVHAYASDSEGAHMAGRRDISVPDCESLFLAPTARITDVVSYATRDASGGRLVFRPSDARVADWVQAVVGALDAVLSPDVLSPNATTGDPRLPAAALPVVRRALLGMLEPFLSRFAPTQALLDVSDSLERVRHPTVNTQLYLHAGDGTFEASDDDTERRRAHWEDLYTRVCDASRVLTRSQRLASLAVCDPGFDCAVERFHLEDDGTAAAAAMAESAEALRRYSLEDHHHHHAMPPPTDARTLADEDARRKRDARLLAKRRAERRRRRPASPMRELLRDGVAPWGTRNAKVAFWKRLLAHTPPGAVPLPIFVLAGEHAQSPTCVRLAHAASAAVQLARELRARNPNETVCRLAADLCVLAWRLFTLVHVTPRALVHVTPPRQPPAPTDDGNEATAAAAGDARAVQVIRGGGGGDGGGGGGLEFFLGVTANAASSPRRDSLPLCLPAVNVHPVTGLCTAGSATPPARRPRCRLPGRTVGVRVPAWMRRRAHARTGADGQALEGLPPEGALPWDGCDPGLLRATLNRARHIAGARALASAADVDALARVAASVLLAGEK